MKKWQFVFLSILFVVVFVFYGIGVSSSIVSFSIDGEVVQYEIYDEEENLLTFKSEVEIGDTILTKDFYEYQIFKIEGNKCYARVLRKLNPPKFSKARNQQSNKDKKLCLYMTHNDESYTLSDGYDSIYGAGGIHDVAKQLKREFQKLGIEVVLDETLHIPHDSSAYSRSSVTAKSLFSSHKPDALFDIHRDGVARKYYYTAHNGVDYSKIRIVVGKSNPNFEENYKFAQEVFAVGNALYPWLFLDIYCGKGHYNQALMSTNLLFEMGTYLIEKEYVLNSVPLLADTIESAMYAVTTVPEEEEDATEDVYDVLIKEDVGLKKDETVAGHKNAGNLIFVAILLATLLGGAFVLSIKKKNK
ncbi:MAG: stage II sporulation protein P [Clostridia bacterium]|nr:stage II sporulation protein P [Clostridia bacterium]